MRDKISRTNNYLMGNEGNPIVDLGDGNKIIDLGIGNLYEDGSAEVFLKPEELKWFYYNNAYKSGFDKPYLNGVGELRCSKEGRIDLIDASGKVYENIMKGEPDFSFSRYISQLGLVRTPFAGGETGEEFTQTKKGFWDRNSKLKKGIALAGVGLCAAVPVAGSMGLNYPGDEDNPYDDTQYLHSIVNVNYNFFENYEGFDIKDKSLNEPIIPPDEITKVMDSNTIPDKKNPKYQVFAKTKISPTDFAAWMAVASEETVAVCPYLALVDTDGNEKPDALYAMYLGQREDGELTSTAGVPREFYDVDGNKIDFKGNPSYLINPFDTLGSDYSNIANLLYFEDPSMINFGDKPTAIHWKDAVGKTPKEIFGGSSNTLVSEPKVHETEIYKNPVEDKSISEEMRTDTTTEKEKTNPMVYAGVVAAGGLALAAVYGFSKGKKSTPTAVA